MKKETDMPFKKEDFGSDFKWGVATASYQIEGAWNEDGKSPSIWDHFTHTRPKKIKNRENADVACDFYNRYDGDIQLVKNMNFDVFRFSISWPRILPEGIGKVNQKGIDFYHRVIDSCLEKGVEPWITMFHWDLPQILEEKGGWSNRDVIDWFGEFAQTMTKAYGDKVKNWMILNEPMAFTSLGYMAGIHAPGKFAPSRFLKATHHTAMVQALGGRIARENVKDAYIGTTFSCSHVEPKGGLKKHEGAAYRLDILLNRLFIEPCLGLGYPTKNFRFLHKIHKYIQADDLAKLKFDFDFIGLQNYTRVVAKRFPVPFIWLNQEKPVKWGVPREDLTQMGWEVYPEGIYKVIKRFNEYKNLPPIIITENGAAFPDKVTGDRVHDPRRVQFFKDYLSNIHRAQQDGMDVRGYFVWTLMDNFEWAEGYHPRFGLVYVDYPTQKRIIKDSGYFFQELLK